MTARQRKPSAAFPSRRVVEAYSDGHREVFHRTKSEVFTHQDTAEARSHCDVCSTEGEELRLPAASAAADGGSSRTHRLDLEAKMLQASCADPSEFDRLRLDGWPGFAAPGSHLLPPCGAECLICNPTVESSRASHRRAARIRKGKR